MKTFSWNTADETVIIKDSTGRQQTVTVDGTLSVFTFHAPEGTHFEPTEDGFLLVADSEEADTPTIVSAN